MHNTCAGPLVFRPSRFYLCGTIRTQQHEQQEQYSACATKILDGCEGVLHWPFGRLDVQYRRYNSSQLSCEQQLLIALAKGRPIEALDAL